MNESTRQAKAVSYFHFEKMAAEVMRRIARRRLARARAAAALYGAAVIAGAALVVPAWRYAASAAAQSGFFQYASLALSNWSDLAGSWGALLQALAASAPIAGISLVLAAALVLAYSIKRLVADIPAIRAYRNAII